MMSYKIADEKLIVNAIQKIMNEIPEINSQELFLKLIKKELNSIDPNIKISAKRLRKIAINVAKIKIKIEYKELDESSDKLKKCPVCGNELKTIYNYTLDGNKIYSGKKCELCQYWTGIKLRLPKRYTFYR